MFFFVSLYPTPEIEELDSDLWFLDSVDTYAEVPVSGVKVEVLHIQKLRLHPRGKLHLKGLWLWNRTWNQRSINLISNRFIVFTDSRFWVYMAEEFTTLHTLDSSRRWKRGTRQLFFRQNSLGIRDLQLSQQAPQAWARLISLSFTSPHFQDDFYRFQPDTRSTVPCSAS